MCSFGFGGVCALPQVLRGMYKTPAFAETFELIKAALCPLTLLRAGFERKEHQKKRVDEETRKGENSSVRSFCGPGLATCWPSLGEGLHFSSLEPWRHREPLEVSFRGRRRVCVRLKW